MRAVSERTCYSLLVFIVSHDFLDCLVLEACDITLFNIPLLVFLHSLSLFFQCYTHQGETLLLTKNNSSLPSTPKSLKPSAYHCVTGEFGVYHVELVPPAAKKDHSRYHYKGSGSSFKSGKWAGGMLRRKNDREAKPRDETKRLPFRENLIRSGKYEQI